MSIEALNDYAQGGFDVLSSVEEQEIREFIEENKMECPVVLYRGIMVDCDYNVEEGETITFKHNFASFDENEDAAREFATRRPYGALFILEDCEALPVYEFTETCNDETEWLVVKSDFVVTKVEKEENLFNVYIKI